jgi:hypothetical protein
MFHLYNLFAGLFIIIDNYLDIRYYIGRARFFPPPSHSHPLIILRDVKVFVIKSAKILITIGTF